MIDKSYVGETTIGNRYQAVISMAARQIANKIKPGERAVVVPIDEYSVIISVEPKSWTESAYGIAKGVWKDVDVKAYIKDLRKDDEEREV